ncbi:MAG TPA: hypothetical protein VG488_11520, partial [Candidatus Angelobacter sp.]|nr:hypothetical protein [Candidatus Angelobacter sp.]
KASEAGDNTCSPQRQLWVEVQAKPQARVAGGIYASVPNIPLAVQIGNNQSGAILGAEDDVRKKMAEGPTHA